VSREHRATPSTSLRGVPHSQLSTVDCEPQCRRVGYFVPIGAPGLQARRKPLNPQPLISHLTNSNGCGNLQPKVLLKVSPLRPFLLPQPSVYPRTPLPTRHSLPTLLLGCPRVTDHESQVTSFQSFAASLASPKKSTPLQSSKSSLFCQNAGVGWASRTQLRDARGGGYPRPYRTRSGGLCLAPPSSITSFRINTCKSVTKQKTLSTCTINTYAKPGEGVAIN
jgi:hypothetical protein